MAKNKTKDRVLVILTILSFLLATGQQIYLYIHEDSDKEISFTTGPERQIILNFQEARPALGKLGFNPTQENGWLMSEDLIVWNSGQYSLEPQDIRSDLRISLSSCEKIVLVETRSAFADEIAQFDFAVDSDVCEATLSWKVFDPGYGVHARIYFTSTISKSGDIHLAGDIKELDRIARRDIYRDIWKVEFNPFYIGTVALVWCFIVGALFLVSSVANFSDEDSDGKTTVSSFLFILLSIVICIVAGIWLWELYIGHANIIESMPFDLDQVS